MTSISYLLEGPNVPNGNANGLTPPFGNYNPGKRNSDILADLQDLNKFPPDEQTKKIRKHIDFNGGDYM